MTCPVCGGDTKVTDSRLTGDTVRRRRECLQCGNRFTTKELDVDLLNRLTDTAAKARKKAQKKLLELKILLDQATALNI